MVSTHTGVLNLKNLPKHTKRVHLFPALHNKSLVSIGHLCDAGCEAIFTATTVSITYQKDVILTGTRSPTTNNLWYLDFPESPTKDSANSITLPHKAAELVAFSHAALFSPVLSTLSTALTKGYIPGFPGLSPQSVNKYPPHSIATHKGHLDQSRKNQRSTKKYANPKQHRKATKTPSPVQQEDSEDFPPLITNGERTNYLYPAVIELTQPAGTIHTDQTGKFPVQSKSGNNYLLILYDYDSNYIHAEPIKNRSASEILRAYQRAHKVLVNAGLRPKLQRLDNECSTLLKDYMHEQNVDYQLVPPGTHRRNAAERAIRTFKNHFIAGLSSVDPKFPLNLWDKLIPQALITLNLLRGSRLNPKLSAYAQVNGPFDFNKTPIAPPGTRVLVHEKPTLRGSWDPHGVDAWYLGPAMESYRCYRTWIWKTQSERISDTLSSDHDSY